MGAFKIEILGVGGHGCERTAKPGDQLYRRCGRFNCPDCVAFDFVQQLKSKGMLRVGEQAQGQELKPGEVAPPGTEVYHTDDRYVSTSGPSTGGKTFWKRNMKAEFTHWPGEPSQVVDDMLTNTRKEGSF